MNLEQRLAAFLAEAARAPFAYGRSDCAMTLANWLAWCGWPDPAAELRGRYTTRIGWLRIVTREGGLDRLVGRLAVAAGMRELELGRGDALAAGDVAVLEQPHLDRGLVAAIYAGGRFDRGRFVIKAAAGLAASRALAPVKAWGFRPAEISRGRGLVSGEA